MNRPFSLMDTLGLEKALDASALRGTVISENIANANTPGYQAKTVVFDGHLRAAMKADAAGDRKALVNLKPVVANVSGKVDVITEMASLAKNQILYNSYISEISRDFSNMKWIIENSGR